MKKVKEWNSEYFYGNKISEYGLENGYVDYRALAGSMNLVLNNDIIPTTVNFGLYWELWSGVNCRYYDEAGEEISYDEWIDNGCIGDEKYIEFYQYYIINGRDAELLADYTDEAIYYNEELDMYVWAISHYGTSWDYVLTDIKIADKIKNKYNEEEK